MTFNDLVGVWGLTRTVKDHLKKDTATFNGTAEITIDGTYTETGQLKLSHGGFFMATRTYIWAPVGNHIEVFFQDGRPFHVIRFDQPEDRHYCDPDIYDVQYDFTNFPVWNSQWRVKGPRKDYVMASCYRKQVC